MSTVHMFVCLFFLKKSYFTFFKSFHDEFKLIEWAAESSYMVQYFLCDRVENLKQKIKSPLPLMKGAGTEGSSAENL